MDAPINLILRFTAAFLQTKLQPPYIFLHYYHYFIHIILSALLLLFNNNNNIVIYIILPSLSYLFDYREQSMFANIDAMV